jgi:hypothetical protein
MEKVKKKRKELRFMKVELAKIVWRILHWIILESLISVHQVIVDFLHIGGSVCWRKGSSEGDLATSRLWL